MAIRPRRLSILARPNGESWPRAARNAWRSYRYPLPAIRTSPLQAHPPTLFFCTPDYDVPTGGIRVVYRHVDLLNETGIPAAVLHARTGFRCSWFEHDTRVLGCRETTVGPEDVVVVSELAAGLLADLPRGYGFVILNQGPHLTWRLPDDVVRHYAASPDLLAILTVSDHGRDLLRYAFPQADVRRVHNSIDPELFHPGVAERPRRITYMSRRGREEARQLLGILRGRGALDGWEVVPLERLTERDVADHLRSSRVFLSFAYQEGFGLPPAEAMACGAYVVGFHGFGGREFLRPEFSHPVDAGDTIAFARTLESVLEQERLEPGWCEARGAAAAEFIRTTYSPERERQDVVGAFASLLDGRPVVRHGPGSRRLRLAHNSGQREQRHDVGEREPQLARSRDFRRERESEQEQPRERPAG
jgi:glycosyltransferase involved in cell wall biosynthesis